MRSHTTFIVRFGLTAGLFRGRRLHGSPGVRGDCEIVGCVGKGSPLVLYRSDLLADGVVVPPSRSAWFVV
jgi:hypothetical protein